MKKLICLFLLGVIQLASGQTNIELVTVGNPGNTPDSTRNWGSVNYTYSIGKYEVTIKQYVNFLNSVATKSTNIWIVALWDPAMQSNIQIAGITRNGDGTDLNPYKYSAIGDDNRPIAYISWFDAARFCNWLHNGATTNSDTETGAYTLNGATVTTVQKNSGARWYLPTENEWYKAAFNKREGGYWHYATSSDTRPGNMSGGYSNMANYRYLNSGTALYALTGSSQQLPTSHIAPVGAFGSPSGWGTMDQSGSLCEWIDTPEGPVLRGGSWFDFDQTRLSRDGRVWESGGHENFYTGFRVVKSETPEPASGTLTLEVSNGVSSGWAEVKLDASMITSDGKINIGPLNGGAKFYRLKVEAK